MQLTDASNVLFFLIYILVPATVAGAAVVLRLRYLRIVAEELKKMALNKC